MNITDDFRFQALPLPGDIQAEKMAGHYDYARKLIERRLADELTPECIKKRLRLELKILTGMEAEYIYTREEAMALMRERIPSFSEEEFDELLMRGRMDFAYINGEKLFAESFCSALLKVYPELWNRTVEGDRYQPGASEEVIQSVKDGDGFGAHIHICHHLTLRPQPDVIGQKVRIHIPVSWEGNPRVSGLTIKTDPPYKALSSEDAGMHSVYFEERAEDGLKFLVDYEYDYNDVYRDMYDMDPALCAEEPPAEIKEKYLCEQLPHISMSPFIKELAAEIVGSESNPLLKARAIYDFITQKCRYRFTRPYRAIENVSEYFLINQQGDCGTQALAFISLCRCAGVPAKWESGTTASPGDIGMHDWAMFYIEGIGWRHADPSFGGGANMRGNEKRRRFYFGNIDPFRNPCNGAMGVEFDPPKKFWRVDDCDNQAGEVEFETRGAMRSEYRIRYEDKGIKRTK
ncbi:MAG TPA: transglutaminase domain-containing protein [Bacillota bacterium]|nr:transglutaminase domain-containing protein [Bacillota bacterium]